MRKADLLSRPTSLPFAACGGSVCTLIGCMKLDWNDITTDPRIHEMAGGLKADAVLGRVVAQDGPVLEVVSRHGVTYARPSGRLAYLIALGSAPVPAIGDYVGLDPGRLTSVRTIVPRRSAFQRMEAGRRSAAQVVCANVDLALIVTTAPPTAAREPASRVELGDFSVRRIERFIATLDPRVRPLVVLNKCDLVRDPDAVRAAVEAELPGVEVCTVSARTGEGVESVRDRLPPGTTAVLVGSSGSGKSTLIARLTGLELRTSSVRETDGRGRHTTTGRRAYAVPRGGLLVDTPGMREVQLWSQADATDRLGAAFAEIDEIAVECRFTDCRHGDEPGCAVREAVRTGRIAQERYLSYLELQNEHEAGAQRREKQERLTARRAARASRMRRRSRGG